MDPRERKTILDRLSKFVSQQRGADELADRDSLERAADLMRLYEDRDWVSELPPPKTLRHAGRPVDPESFSRFTKWLRERVPLSGSLAYRLRDAHELETNYFASGEIIPSGEYVLRPLKWLTKHEYGDRVPEVWAIACEMAGNKSPDNPTVRRALSKWKHDNLPKTEHKGRPRGGQALVDRWLQDAHRIMEEYPELFIDAVNRVEAEAEEYFTPRKHSVA